MKAILFSNFPKEVFNNTLKPKFDQYGVEIVKVANIDRSPNVELGEVDVVVAMVELMSGGQRAKVKELARKNGKRFLGLSRKGADWAKEFATIEGASKRAAPGAAVSPPQSTRAWTPVVVPSPPPSEPEPESEESVPQLAEPTELADMLNMFEQENERLEERIRELEARDRSGVEQELVRRLGKADDELRALRTGLEKTKGERDQQVAETRKAKKKLEELEKSTVSRASYAQLSEQYASATKALAEANERLKSRVDNSTKTVELEAGMTALEKELENHRQFVSNAQRQVNAYQVSVDGLNKELEAALAVKKKQGEELFKLKQENEQLRKNPGLYVDDGEMKKLRDELDLLRKRATVKTTEDFLRVREAFATLWRAGAMTDREILDKLMNWKPKEG